MRSFVSLLAGLLFLPIIAGAHAFPVTSDPRAGAAVEKAPSQIVITFDDEIEPAFSKIRVENLYKKAVDRNDSHLDSKNHKILIVGLPTALPPGEYRVNWNVLSVDGHRTEGYFTFKIIFPHDPHK